MDYRWVYEELGKLDRFLGLPEGTTGSVMSFDPDAVSALNEGLKPFGIAFAGDGALDPAARGKWKELLQQVGISRAWWMDGDPCVAKLPTEIKKL